MRIGCRRCGCPIEVAAQTAVGAPLMCPRCGLEGTYEGSAPRARPASTGTSPVLLVLLGVVMGGCLGSAFAIALPWTTVALSAVTLVGAAVLLFGVVGKRWTLRWPLGIGALLVASWTLVIGATSGVAQGAAEEQRARQEAAQAEAEGARQDALRQQASTRIAAAQQHLAGAEQSIARLDGAPMQRAAEQLAPLAELVPPPEGYAEALARVQALNAQLAQRGAARFLDEATAHADASRWAEARSSLETADGYVVALASEDPLRARRAALQARGRVHWEAIAAIARAQTALDAEHADAVAAEAAYDTALASLDGAESDAHTREVRALRRRVQAARRRNHRAAERLSRSRAERAAQALLCGSAPLVSAWDGELIGAERFVGQGAHDPDSIDVEQCTVPSLAVDTDHCWLSTCVVRGRNLFGAMTRSRMQFEVARGVILSGRTLR